MCNTLLRASVNCAAEVFSNEDPQSEAELRCAVQEYLAEHPYAMDTPEGIAEWWLQHRERRIEFGLLTRVLDDLVEAGVLEKVCGGSETMYRSKR